MDILYYVNLRDLMCYQFVPPSSPLLLVTYKYATNSTVLICEWVNKFWAQIWYLWIFMCSWEGIRQTRTKKLLSKIGKCKSLFTFSKLDTSWFWSSVWYYVDLCFRIGLLSFSTAAYLWSEKTCVIVLSSSACILTSWHFFLS